MEQTKEAEAFEGKKALRIIYEHGQPHGIRDEGGFLVFFHPVWKYEGQDERYREELEERMRLADYLLYSLQHDARLSRSVSAEQAAEIADLRERLREVYQWIDAARQWLKDNPEGT